MSVVGSICVKKKKVGNRLQAASLNVALLKEKSGVFAEVSVKQKNDLRALMSDVLQENISKTLTEVFLTREAAIDETICVREYVKRRERFVHRIFTNAKLRIICTKNRWKDVDSFSPYRVCV